MLSAYRLSSIIILLRSRVQSDVMQSVRASSDFNSFMRLSSKPALARYSAAMRLSASLIRLLPEKSYKISKQHISAACLLAAGARKGDVELRKEEKEVIMTKNRENIRKTHPLLERKRGIRR